MRREQRGTGMTRREVALVESAREFDEAFPADRPTFERAVANVEANAEAFLRSLPDSGRTAPDDAPEDYAQRILNLILVVRHAIKSRRADEAARFALSLGELLAEYRIKTAHERTWLTGDKLRRTLREASGAANARRRRQQAEQWRRWQTEADEVWHHRPNLSVAAVAKRVRQELHAPEAVKSIARRLKKPPHAG